LREAEETTMSNDDDDLELPSAEELRENAQSGIDCLATRWGMAIAVEVLERLWERLDEDGRYNASALKHLLGKDLMIEGQEPFHFSDELLVSLRQDAKEIVEQLMKGDQR
jgi:hypothetical protein